MYIFRLAPIKDDRSKWQNNSAIQYTEIVDPDYELYAGWDSSVAYMTGEYVTRNQYVMVSLKNNNEDDPIYNYVGRTPDPWRDGPYFGQNSWLRLRTASRWACFNKEQPGYTWSVSGNISFTVIPTLAMSAEEAYFFGDGTVSTPLYLVLSDIVGDSISITYKDVNGNTISTETVALTHTDDFISDWSFNLELPGTPENTIIRKYDMLSGVYSISITITPPTTGGTVRRAGLGGFYIGRATKLGVTQQDKLSFGYTDFSRLTEDAWGHISIYRRKFSRNIDAEVFVPTQKADNVFRLIQHVRVTPTFFLFSNRLDEAIIPGTIISGLTCITGLVKTSAIDKQSAKASPLKIFIESLPVSFNDLMIRENTSICGMSPLPVVPIVDTTPVVPVTPPVSTVAVTGVSLNKETLVAYTNKTYTLIATIMPSNAGNKSVTWTSSVPEKATISSLGIVTGVAPGSSVITATTVDGGFTDICTVNVIMPEAPPPPWQADIFIFYKNLDTEDNVFKFNLLRT